MNILSIFFFFQAEDGIRDLTVTGVQTCALPIFSHLCGPSIESPRQGALLPPCSPTQCLVRKDEKATAPHSRTSHSRVFLCRARRRWRHAFRSLAPLRVCPQESSSSSLLHSFPREVLRSPPKLSRQFGQTRNYAQARSRLLPNSGIASRSALPLPRSRPSRVPVRHSQRTSRRSRQASLCDAECSGWRHSRRSPQSQAKGIHPAGGSQGS